MLVSVRIYSLNTHERRMSMFAKIYLLDTHARQMLVSVKIYFLNTHQRQILVFVKNLSNVHTHLLVFVKIYSVCVVEHPRATICGNLFVKYPPTAPVNIHSWILLNTNPRHIQKFVGRASVRFP